MSMCLLSSPSPPPSSSSFSFSCDAGRSRASAPRDKHPNMGSRPSPAGSLHAWLFSLSHVFPPSSTVTLSDYKCDICLVEKLESRSLVGLQQGREAPVLSTFSASGKLWSLSAAPSRRGRMQHTPAGVYCPEWVGSELTDLGSA